MLRIVPERRRAVQTLYAVLSFTDGYKVIEPNSGLN